MRVAVTGASGFCGGHVARAFVAAGHEVVSVGRRPGPVGTHRSWDATSGADAPLDGVDAVVHLAAAVGDARGPAFETVNVGGTAAVLRGAGDAVVVHVSSASVYDHRRARGAIREDAVRGGWTTPYARTKAAAEDLVLEAHGRVLRPHAVYGPGDPHLLPRLLAAVRRDRAVLPGRDVALSVTHVANLADACVDAVGWRPGAYNVADAEPVGRDSLVVRAVTAATGRAPEVRVLPVAVARAAAAGAELVARARGRSASVTRYAVDQLAHPFVLDLTRALDAGYAPAHRVDDHLAALAASHARGGIAPNQQPNATTAWQGARHE